MAEIVKANIANALNSLSGVLGTANQIKMNNDTAAPDVATALGYKQDSFDVDASLELQNDVLKVAQGGIDTYRLANASVTADKIADKAVTANKILEGSINSSHIISGGIQNNHLASSAVSEGKLSNDVVYKLNGLNIGQIVFTSVDEVVFESQEEFDKLEDLLKYNYYVEGTEGRLKLTPYLDNSTAIIIDNQTFYRCLFEYEDKYMNWDSDPVGSNKKCATIHGFVIPTYCRYDEPYIIFKFAGTSEEKAECANMVNVVIGHAYKADYSQYFPSTT